MNQSVYSVGGIYPTVPSADRSHDAQTFRGVLIGIGVSAVLWAPLGLIALRLF